MKVKSSIILTKALHLIESKQLSFVCAAIDRVFADMVQEANENIVSNASTIWMQLNPPHISDDIKYGKAWWPKGDPKRIATLRTAITIAESRND